MMIYRSGREFLEDNDPLQRHNIPGGGIETKKPVLCDFKEETLLAATSGALEPVVESLSPRMRERW